VVETGGLENRLRGNSHGGSNPSSSANFDVAAEIAESQHMSVDEVFAAAFAEQLAALERLRQRATHGSREKFLARA
jgi:hypothetical protein